MIRHHKKGITSGYSLVFFFTFVVILLLLYINIMRVKSGFNFRFIGEESLDMLKVEQNSEIARDYLHNSAELALKQTIDQFTNSGSTISSDGVYPVLKEDTLESNFLDTFKSNLRSILFSNSYMLPTDYKLYANFTGGTDIIGVPDSPMIYLRSKPLSPLDWPVALVDGKREIIKDGCYRFDNNKILKKMINVKGILITSKDNNVYSIAGRGKVLKVFLAVQQDIPCYDEKTKSENYDCDSLGEGNYVIIKYPNFDVKYARLSSINVREGENIDKRQVIGKFGNTGLPWGNALLLEVYENNKPINPLCFYSDVYFNDSTKSTCMQCNEKRYTNFIPFEVHDKFQISTVDNLRTTLLSIKKSCYSSQDFGDCVRKQVLALRGEGYNVKLMGSCERGVFKPFYNLSAFIEDCANSKNKTCYCDYSIGHLADSDPNLFTSSEEYEILMNQTFFGLRISLVNKTKGSREEIAQSVIPSNFRLLSKYGEAPFIGGAVVSLTSVPYLSLPGKPVRTFTKNLVLFKHGENISIVYPNEREDVENNNPKCILNNDTVRVCINGLKFEITSHHYKTLR